ncbi:MAG: hypothetical protein ABI597_09135 [Gammaproteobacteria bacterium]
MKRVWMIGLSVIALAISSCAELPQNANTSPSIAKNKVHFQLPPSQKWDLISVEQDANGYAKSYRSVSAKGLESDQSFYINFGRNIRTPLLESMHEVVGSMASTGCRRTTSKMLDLEKNSLVFIATANQCMAGRPVWQIFKVFNMQDGQYSIVYSANPGAVPIKTMQQMKTVVIKSNIVRI